MKMEPFPDMLSKTHSISLIDQKQYQSLLPSFQAPIHYIHSNQSDCFHHTNINLMSFRRQLEQEFFQLFANKGVQLLSNRHLAALTHESYHSVEDIFKARYDELFIANIPSQSVFEKTINDLENIIAASKDKLKTKNKATLIMQDQTYLQHYLELLFTEKDKKILQSLIKTNFHQSVEEEEPQNSTAEVVGYILKGIFGMQTKQTEREKQQYEHSVCQMDFD